MFRLLVGVLLLTEKLTQLVGHPQFLVWIYKAIFYNFYSFGRNRYFFSVDCLVVRICVKNLALICSVSLLSSLDTYVIL